MQNVIPQKTSYRNQINNLMLAKQNLAFFKNTNAFVSWLTCEIVLN